MPPGIEYCVPGIGAGTQAFGVLTGIQDKFDWKGVALAAISAGVTAGLSQGLGGIKGPIGELATQQSLFGSKALGGLVHGAVTGAISEGIGVATGLKDKFDWAGVAASAVGNGASSAVNLKGPFGMMAKFAADGLASAATRSLITGTSFGDNIVAVLPSVIGRTIGNLVGESIIGNFSRDRITGGTQGWGSKGTAESASKGFSGPSSSASGFSGAKMMNASLATNEQGDYAISSPLMGPEANDALSDNNIVVTARRYQSTYRIDRGDTMWKIAKLFNTDVNQLIGMNDIQDVYNIAPGTFIHVPNHIVKPGESLRSIARHYDTSEAELRYVNQLGTEAPREGQALIIRGGGEGGDTRGLVEFAVPRERWAQEMPNYRSMSRRTTGDYDEIVFHDSGNAGRGTPQAVEQLHRGNNNDRIITMLTGYGYHDPWADVGYNFLISRDGTVYEGRNLDFEPSHVGSHNSGRIGVVLLSDGGWGAAPTEAQFASAERLYGDLAQDYTITRFSTHDQYDRLDNQPSGTETVFGSSRLERIAIEHRLRWGPRR